MAFDLATAKPVKMGFDISTAKPVEDDEAMPQAKPKTITEKAKAILKPFSTAAKSFFPAFGESATFGVLPMDHSPLEGSIFEPRLQKTARKAGSFLGSMVPIVASEATGGAAAELGGLGSVGQAAASGLTYGAARGAAQNKPVLDTAKGMAEDVATFGGIAVAGQALGYLRKVFGEYAVDKLSNYFLKTDPGIAGKAARSGEESIGKQALKYEGRFDKNRLSGFKSRKEILGNAKDELGLLRNEAGGIIDQIDTEAAKPQIKPTDRPLLTYDPASPKTRGPVIRPPKSVETPPFPAIEGGPEYRGRPDRVGFEFQDPKVGTIGGFEETGLRTEGGKHTIETGKFMKGRGEGLFDPTDLRSGSNISFQGKEIFKGEVKLREQKAINKLSEEQAALNEQRRIEAKKADLGDWEKSYPYTFGKRGPFIDMEDVATDLNGEIAKMSRVGKRTGPSKAMKTIQKDFVQSNPRFVSIADGIEVKTALDQIVNDAYENKLVDVSNRDKIYSTLANGIRKRAYEISPELGANFDKQSLMHDVITSLEPTQRETGTLPYGGFWRHFFSGLSGNRFALGGATALNRTLGAPSRFIAPAARQVSRALIAPFAEDQSGKFQLAGNQ